MKKLIFIFGLILTISASVFAQGNGFNFQGRLNDGTNPANGSYDLQFSLFNAATAGTQIGTTIARPNTTLINGVFSVNLDFGATAFNNPNSIFIEIGIKPNGSPNAFTILGPRQQLTVVPFSVRATSATNADNAVNAQNATNAVNAQNATTATTATTATNALSLGGASASSYARLNLVNTGNFSTTGDILIDGNARQFSTSNGFVKAMIYYDGNTISRCYNGITNSDIVPCGFVVDKLTIVDGFITYLHYRINFGFAVNSRFFSITSQGAPYRTATMLSNNNDPRNGCGPSVVMNANTQCVATQDPDDAHLPFYLIVY